MFLLASASPRRKALLEKAGYVFEVKPSNIDEPIQSEDPTEHAELTAKMKAEAVEGEVVLAADTVVSLDKRIIGKPKDEEDAIRILKRLSGRKHEVITGVALICNGKTTLQHEKTELFFRELSDDEISQYARTGEPLGKAGAYAIQRRGFNLISRISGSYTNVVGLPMELTKRMLSSVGIEPTTQPSEPTIQSSEPTTQSS